MSCSPRPRTRASTTPPSPSRASSCAAPRPRTCSWRSPAARPSATLRQRCVTWPAGVDPLDLPPEVHERVDAAAEELAGASALAVRLGCPECGSDVAAEVDPVALLADRVSDEVRDLLGDVAELAAAFGWSETEVLQLSEARRRAYLDLARQAGAAMSDVFDRLVARATHRAPMVVARRPSRFEPSSAGLRAPAPRGPPTSRATMPPAPNSTRSGEILSAASGSARSAASRSDAGRAAWATRLRMSPHRPRPRRRPVARHDRHPGASAPRPPHDPPGLPSHHPRSRASVPTQARRGRPPARHRVGPGHAPLRHPHASRRAPALLRRRQRPRRDALAPDGRGVCRTAPRSGPGRRAGSATGDRGSRCPANDSRGPTSRTIAAATLLADHLGPALVEAGALTESEVARLVAVAPGDRDRPRRDGRTPVAIEPVDVPTTGRGAPAHRPPRGASPTRAARPPAPASDPRAGSVAPASTTRHTSTASGGGAGRGDP